jgi:hypothetical protein
MIPDNWNYQHSDYLLIETPVAPALPIPIGVPPNGARPLAAQYDANENPVLGWQSSFSAAFVSTRFR